MTFSCAHSASFPCHKRFAVCLVLTTVDGGTEWATQNLAEPGSALTSINGRRLSGGGKWAVMAGFGPRVVPVARPEPDVPVRAGQRPVLPKAAARVVGCAAPSFPFAAAEASDAAREGLNTSPLKPRQSESLIKCFSQTLYVDSFAGIQRPMADCQTPVSARWLSRARTSSVISWTVASPVFSSFSPGRVRLGCQTDGQD